MAKNYIGAGKRINIPANVLTSAVTSGDLVLIDKMVGVVLHDGAANAPNVLKLDGEFSLAKDTGAGTGAAIGAIAYRTTGGNVTAISTANDKVGIFTATVGDNDAVAIVRLDSVGI